MLHKLVAKCNSKQRILLCAPSNKAVCVAIERYRATSLPGSWKSFPVVLVGVQDKIDNCSAPLPAGGVGDGSWGWNGTGEGPASATCTHGIIRDQMQSIWLRCASCTRHDGKSSAKRAASSSSVPSPPPSTTPQRRKGKKKGGAQRGGGSGSEGGTEHGEADAAGMAGGCQPFGLVSPALLRVISSVSDPSTAPDLLIYTYSQRLGDALRALSVALDCCVQALVCSLPCTVLQSTLCAAGVQALNLHLMCPICLRALVLTSFKCVVNEYHSIVNTLTCVIPYFVAEQLTTYHAEVTQHLHHLSTCFEQATTATGNRDNAHLDELLLQWASLQSSLGDMSSQFFLSGWDNDISCELMRNAVVVCSTLSSSGCSVMRSSYAGYGFDALLVDEAGQCLESELIIPLVYNPKHLILIGDPRQLPATVLSVEAQRLGLGVSTMQRLMYNCNAPYHMLSTQYRMHPSICIFPNKRFYNEQLNTDTSVLLRPNLVEAIVGYCPRSRQSFNWMDSYTFVDISHKEGGGGYGGKSKTNSGEAALIAR